jgi:hypothetical protein
MFLVLASKEDADRIADLPLCMQGPMLAQFIEDYGHLPDRLWSERPQRQMRFVVKFRKGNIMKIESLHASLRRRIKMRSVQTHGQDFAELCSEWITDRARLRQQHSFLASHGCEIPATEVFSKPSAASSSSSGITAEQALVEFQREPNPWNAFIRLMTLDTKGRFTHLPMVELAPLYHARSAEMQQRIDTLIMTARMTRSLPTHSGGSFGDTARQLDRKLAKERLAVIHNHLAIRDAGVGSRFSAIQAAVETAQRQPTSTLGDMLVAAQSELAAYSGAVKQMRIRDEKSVQAWYETEGKQTLEFVLDAVPSLKPLEASLHIVPDGFSKVVELNGSLSSFKSIASAIADTAGRGRDASTRDVITQHMQQSCSIIMHDECAPSKGKGVQKRGIPPCHTVGICLCSPDGILTYLFRNEFLRLLKLMFPAQDDKELIRSRKVVIKFTGKSDAPEPGYATAMARLLGEPLVAMTSTVWVHLSMMNFSPYRPTFKVCHVDDGVEEEVRHGEVHLYASHPNEFCKVCWYCKFH